MIQIVFDGAYRLFETKNGIKILELNDKYFCAWLHTLEIGDFLVATYKYHRVSHLLATGKFRLYKVKHEKEYTDLLHLELQVGEVWQGYLLPTGLPIGMKKRSKIIPTDEHITSVIPLNDLL
jgi:hypothetical protein